MLDVEMQRADANNKVTQLEHELETSNTARDELQRKLNESEEMREQLKTKLASVRIFQPDGRHRSWPDDVRKLYMKYLVHRVAPSDITELVASAIDTAVPFAISEGLKLPGTQFSRDLRFELLALCKYESSLSLAESGGVGGVKALGVDGTPIDQTEVATANGRLRDGTDLVFGGAFRLTGQTAAREAAAVGTMFERLNANHAEYVATYKQMFGDAPPTADATVGLHQMGGGGVITTDNAAAATKQASLLVEMIEKASEEFVGAEAFGRMDDDERSKVLGLGKRRCHSQKTELLFSSRTSAQSRIRRALHATLAEYVAERRGEGGDRVDEGRD